MTICDTTSPPISVFVGSKRKMAVPTITPSLSIFQNGAVEVAGQQKPPWPFLAYFGLVRASGCPHGPNGRYRRVNHELGWVKNAIASSFRPSWASVRAQAAAHQNFDLDPTSDHSLRVLISNQNHFLRIHIGPFCFLTGPSRTFPCNLSLSNNLKANLYFRRRRSERAPTMRTRPA